MTHDDLFQQQIAYYRARAGEYDEWFLRQGRYDRGEASNQEWFDETRKLVTELDEFSPAGRVLEFACGTGLFTQHLARHAESVTAIDASAEVIEINRQRCAGLPVHYVQTEIFDWRPEENCDVAFFSFWLSHVPPERFVAFWKLVRASLKPGGRVFFIDSLYNPESTANNHSLRGTDSVTSTRRLNDGREFEIYKVFYQPEKLETELAKLGFRASVKTTGKFFLYGSAEWSRFN